MRLPANTATGPAITEMSAQMLFLLEMIVMLKGKAIDLGSIGINGKIFIGGLNGMRVMLTQTLPI